jgi:hypothetical protein
MSTVAIHQRRATQHIEVLLKSKVSHVRASRVTLAKEVASSGDPRGASTSGQ